MNRYNPSLRAGRTYFAAEPFNRPLDSTIGKKLITKIEEYENHELVRRVDDKLALAYKHYYGYSPDGFHATSIVARAGDQGELAEIRVNHARALVNALLNLIIKDKFVWQPRAANYSYEAVRQTELANSVLEHYWHNHRVKAYADRAVEEAIAFTEGFVHLEWDEASGMLLPNPDQDTGFLRTGDLRFTNVSSWDVIRDPSAVSFDELRWTIVRTIRNRYDLAARIDNDPDLTPEEKEALCNKVYTVDSLPYRGTTKKSRADDWESDNLPVFVFYHKPDAILPFGRETHVLADGTVIKDRGLELDFIPLFRVSPAELIGTPYGYSQFLEILGIQEMADAVYSSLATNISTFATQSIIVEEGTNLQVEDFAGGMKVLYRPQGSEKAIEPLQLTRSPPEAFEFVKDLKMHQELLMGLNETTRGQIQTDRMSGSLAAMMDTQSLRQASTLSGNYIRMVQQLGTAVIRYIRKKAKDPLKISMVGRSKMSLIRETAVTGKDLDKIDQVFVDVGNPMLQNPIGRYEMAKELLTLQLIKTPEQMQEVIETGRLDPVTQSDREELRNILRENESITEGNTPRVMLHDNHLLHGKEHSAPVSSPEARDNPAIIKAYMDHMHQHYMQFYGVSPGEEVIELDAMGMPTEETQFQQTDPLYRERMLILSGQQPPPPMMPAGMAGMPGAMPPEGGPAPGSAPAPAPEGGPVSEPGQPELPKQPQNPQTGQRWDSTTGGGAVMPTT